MLLNTLRTVKHGSRRAAEKQAFAFAIRLIWKLTGGRVYQGPFQGLSFADSGLLLAILPPGAFFSLAIAVAAKNALDRRRQQRHRTGVGQKQRSAP